MWSKQLGWQAKTSFKELMELMVEADLERNEAQSGRRRVQGQSR